MFEPSTDPVTVADLRNAVECLLLADWLSERGRTEEEAILRDEESIPIQDLGRIFDARTADVWLVRIAVIRELQRLGVYEHPEDPEVYAAADLPKGWLRISDGTGTAIAPGHELLDAVREVEGDERNDHFGEPSAWESFWDAVAGFGNREPAPDDVCEALEEENGWAFFRVKLNVGEYYVYCPAATNDWRALNLASDYSEQYDTLQEAREAAFAEDDNDSE
jgi:hypothetical protein